MDFSIKNSFKSKQARKNSGSSNNDHVHEGLPILSPDERHSESPANEATTSLTPHHPPMPTTSAPPADHKDVVVHINEGNPSTTLWRGSSYDFWKDADKRPQDDIAIDDAADFNFQPPASAQAARPIEDPPSSLLGQFLHKQKASGDHALDTDLEMDELREDRNLPAVDESPRFLDTSKELKVSFHPAVSNVAEQPDDSVRRRYKDTVGDEEFQRQQRHQPHGIADSDDGAEVVRCTSSDTVERNISFQRRSSLLRAKTRSRLMDPPEEPSWKSGRIPKSGPIPKSGFLGRMDDEEDDPFEEEDLPEKYSKVTFNTLTFMQWVSLVLIVAFLTCSLSIPYLRQKDLWQLQLWKWDVMILILICGRLVSGWGIRIVVFFVERNFFLRKRVLYFVYGVRKPVQNCLWLGLVLIAWHCLFDKQVQRETHNNVVLEYVTKILICFLVGTLVWLVKTLIVKVLASSFHVSTYFDRIQESLFNQFVIEALSGPPLVELQKAEEEDERLADEFEKLQSAGINIPADLRASALSAKSGRLIGSGRSQKSHQTRSGKISHASSRRREEGITIDHLHKMNPNNVSAWNMKRLMNIIRHGSITTLDEQAVNSLQDDESATQIKSENEAKAAAKKIFENVARRGSRYIYPEDLMRFMREDEALKTMSLFEGASDSGKISRSSLKNWVVKAFRERRALALTLNDTKTAVNKLHKMTNFIVAIIILVMWLLILDIATSQFLVFTSSQLVLAAFIFGNTCKTVFEAIIFLFVIHPFDVGDRCEVDGVQMVVEEMNILTTVFLRYDNMRLVFPNSILAMKPIHNFYRSPDMGDSVEFCVHIATPADKIAALKQRITSYIDNKKDHWYPSPMFVVKDVESLNRLKIAVWLCHRMNHQDIGEKWMRRAQLVEELSKILRELDIQYRLLPLDINVLNVPTVTSERVPPSWMATRG